MAEPADAVREGRWTSLRPRILTAAIGTPLFIGIVWVGAWPLWALTWAMALVGSAEFSTMLKKRDLDLPFWGIGSLTAGVLLDSLLHWPLWPVLLALFFLAAIYGLGGSDNQRGFMTGESALYGAVYIGGLMSYLIRLRDLPHGFFIVFFVLAVVWLNDAGAYFIGRRFGRHRLLPRVSPGKTWEGSLGGLVCGLLVAVIYAFIVGQSLSTGLLAGLVVSVAGQMGDLVESNFKRFVGAKDSGGVLPGHGGVLDRLDSALFALPAAYYFLKGIGLS
ncbi:MAG: phosphatidate cytidylyltransferase [Firmicutes bacterium]|nr:phosphatidate cytidylyltransferase [Bacillota bacterium]